MIKYWVFTGSFPHSVNGQLVNIYFILQIECGTDSKTDGIAQYKMINFLHWKDSCVESILFLLSLE